MYIEGEVMKKIWEGIKSAFRWVVRIFEDSAGLPSSKRVFGALLVSGGIFLAFSGGESMSVGILIGGGLGMFGVSSWSK